MTKILKIDDFSKVNERLDIKPMSAERMSKIQAEQQEENAWLKKSEAPSDSREYADFIWDAYEKIQNNILDNNYNVIAKYENGNVIVRIGGHIGIYKRINWNVEYKIRHDSMYTAQSMEDSSIFLDDNHKIMFKGWDLPAVYKSVYYERVKEHGLLGMRELLCDDKYGVFNDRITAELDNLYDANNTWKMRYAKEVADGLYAELENEYPVVIEINTRRWQNMRITPYLRIGLKGSSLRAEGSDFFRFNLEEGKIDCTQTPLMYLSPFDKSGKNEYNPRLKYMAMRSAEDLLKECGGKPWRKVSYKNSQDIIKKVLRFVKDCFPLMSLYCGGLELKGGTLRGTLPISIAVAEKSNL